ncbi:MAG: S9 family peptidase [Gemmatimonadaceae bacterium]|nr:S9 family peptidase [Gemmatimonadaceae bacterium]
MRPIRLDRSLARCLLVASLCVLGLRPLHAQRRAPTVDDLLNLESVGGAQLSPDGRWVAFTVTSTDWKGDTFVSQLWVADASSGARRQLTRDPKGVSGVQWSPDGAWLSFLSAREEGKSQLFALRLDGGEPLRLTSSERGVGNYRWSPSGRTIAFTSSGDEAKGAKERLEQYGAFEVVRRDYAFSHLYTIDVNAALSSPQPGRARTSGTNYTVQSFAWSPDETRIAFSATLNPDLIQGKTANLYIVTLGGAAAGGDAVRPLVTQPGPDNSPVWSPDGTQIAFSSTMGSERYFASNSRIAVVPAAGGTPTSLTDAFDENPNLIDWRAGAIWFAGAQRTASHLFKLDPSTRRITRVSGPDGAMIGGVSLSADASSAAFTLSSPTALPEIAVSPVAAWAPRVVTDATRQLQSLQVASREVISWRSRDGATIEGILIKPANFDPARKHPLLCVIHGGPTGTDRPALPDNRYYPVDIWAARGALVLKVNYRGSAGYGQAFRTLNVRNLGVGDAWDVLSGVDFLIAKGWVDPARVASMGWSQGGYISAFLTTTSTRFAAISVGAGISNWATYYYNTDITPFTINYLGDDPAADPAIYDKTSPMHYIKQARTPTLIQHGELDRRVPIANAYELRQGLEDRGVPVEMIVYKGYGHGITKPKSMRAVMQHNLAWFNHYLWGDSLPDLRLLGKN